MSGYAVVKVLSLLLASKLATSDRLDSGQQVPVLYSASPQGGGQSFSYQNNVASDYKNLYKGSSSVYTSSSTPALLHKAHYSPPRVSNSHAEQHRDFVPIVKQTFEPNSGDGAYSFSYETGNGITASEYGTYKAGFTDEEGIKSASGTYSYTGPDNIVYTITYTAGVEGFLPQGAHIPTPPPIPEAIQKTLQYTSGEEDSDAYQNKPNKYQQYGAGKYQQSTNEPSKTATYVTNLKDQPSEGVGASSNRYTAAVQIPYIGYRRNAIKYGKLPSSYSNNEYKVHDDFTN